MFNGREQISRTRAFTLFELLVVLSVIGILVGLLLPAVQSIRESARRVDCANRVKQIVTAMMNHDTAHRRFPSGYSNPGMAMWSAYILPYIEQDNLHGTLDINGPWRVDPDETPNSRSLSVLIQVFRCPSADIATRQLDPLINAERVPSCYLACASGLINRESGELPWCGMNEYKDPSSGTLFPESDGVFYFNSRTSTGQIKDGLANTALVGETILNQYLFGIDHGGNRQKVDHWYIGSGELWDYVTMIPFGSADVSECLASTACPINSIKIEASSMDDKELSYGSSHLTGVNIGFADGHIQFVRESVDLGVWSAIGSRAGNEVVQQLD